MSTIKDVAERANVSIATVSRVLNDNRYVSAELRERVVQAVRDLNYAQNAVARSLRRSQSDTLGIIIPDASNPFFAEITRGAEAACFEQGYLVFFCNTGEDSVKASWYLNTLYQNRVAGLILVSPGDLREDLRRHLDAGDPIVLVDRRLPDVEADTVESDNVGGAQLAIEHLISLGHRRIGLLTSTARISTTQARMAGVQVALKAAGIPFDERLVYAEGNLEPDTGGMGAQFLLAQADPPTAIFAFNDLIALGVLSYAYQRGLRVPDELSVIGFDDIQLAAYAVPPLTTIEQPKYELGRRAAELLIARLAQPDSRPTRETLLTRLVVRATTAPPLR
jgi:LacI family transcriptional regulator